MSFSLDCTVEIDGKRCGEVEQDNVSTRIVKELTERSRPGMEAGK